MPGYRRRSFLSLAAVVVALIAPVTADRPANLGPPLPSVTERDWRGTVSAFPMPGTPTAHPKTTISLRGAIPDSLGDLEVRGAATGPHPGDLQPHPDGKGVTFRPDEPFQRGEQVTVRTGLDVRGGGENGFRFAVARPANLAVPQGSGSDGPEDTEPATLRDYHTFRTMPGLRPPKVDVVDPADDPSRGYVFLGPKRNTVQRGPMIIDPRGDLVWFRTLSGKTAYDLKVQEYRGETVLTWWEGAEGPGYGAGELVIVDNTYREIARVKAANGYDADMHDFVITPRGTALLLGYSAVQWNVSSVGGPVLRPVIEAVVQEVDIETGALLFEWHSLAAVRLGESYQRVEAEEPAYDYIHPNSVALDSDGDLLVSARHTSTVYKIDRTTGQIIWRLGGKRSDFELGPGVRFGWQHDARRRENGHLTIFDNGGNSEERKLRDYSRGIVLDLDMATMTAELVREYAHPDDVLSFSQANMQLLPDGDVLLGWGSRPRFTQFSPDGDVVFDARLPRETQSYRAFRFPWTGRPTTRPAVAAELAGGGDAVIVYASWNGATEVADWQVLAGSSEVELEPVTTVPRDGFETSIVVDAAEPLVAVRAKDDEGSTLATSKPVRVQRYAA